MELLNGITESQYDRLVGILNIITTVMIILSVVLSIYTVDRKRKIDYKKFLNDREQQQRDFGKHN